MILSIKNPVLRLGVCCVCVVCVCVCVCVSCLDLLYLGARKIHHKN